MKNNQISGYLFITFNANDISNSDILPFAINPSFLQYLGIGRRLDGFFIWSEYGGYPVIFQFVTLISSVIVIAFARYR
jgi:hypothetical protein